MRVLHFEGVNFSETVFDTEDLPLTRGGSATISLAPRAFVNFFNLTDAITFSSTAVALLEDDTLTDEKIDNWISTKNPESSAQPDPLRKAISAMSFTWGFGEASDFETAWDEAKRSARRQRFRRLSTMGISSPDPRKELGTARVRKQYYHAILGDVGLGECIFPTSFEDILANRPKNVPGRLANKLLFLHFDADSAGSRIETGSWEAFANSSAKFGSQHATHLSAVLRTCKVESESVPLVAAETIFHGADETLVVTPAWKVREVITAMNKSLSDANVRYSVAAIVADRKTPIRQVRSFLARTLQEMKAIEETDDSSRLHITIESGLELPYDTPGEALNRLFGAEDFDNDAFRHCIFKLNDFLDLYELATSSEFSRSDLYTDTKVAEHMASTSETAGTEIPNRINRQRELTAAASAALGRTQSETGTPPLKDRILLWQLRRLSSLRLTQA